MFVNLNLFQILFDAETNSARQVFVVVIRGKNIKPTVLAISLSHPSILRLA
jgi:hypothetical protein